MRFRRLRAAAIAFAFFPASLLIAGCGLNSFSVGSIPFPSEKPVFVDNTGQPTAALPDSNEPFRLILLDFPWCPPCANVWKSLRDASRAIPAGSVRVYRILFDSERLLSLEKMTDVAPLRPAPPADAGALPVTTVFVLPRSFKEIYAPSSVPLLLLTDRKGRVIRRWTGSSSSLSAAIVDEVTRQSSAPPLPET